MKFYKVDVIPSAAKKKLGSVPAYVISAIEIGAPDCEEKLDWKLLTDLEVLSFKDAMIKIGWYEKRWHIEVYHKILKSGCQVLQCRLQTAERLLRYVSLMTVVAWRIFWMTMVSRNAPDLRPATVMTSEEMEAIELHAAKKKRYLSSRSKANDWVRELARLGGFLGRKSDGDPGPLVLWRGYVRLQDIMLGISLVPE